MRPDDLDAADAVLRLAFGTERGLPDPSLAFGDSDLIRPRWRTPGTRCFVAEAGGAVIGSAVLSVWGSLAVLGPVSVHPAHWNGGVARGLLAPAVAAAGEADARATALFTHPASPRHLRLYESAGFASGHLISVMERAVDRAPGIARPVLLSFQGAAQQARTLAACKGLAGRIMPGLDLTGPMRAAAEQGHGDTVLVYRGAALAGFALCHAGAGSEAGSSLLRVKFLAADPAMPDAFPGLVGAVEAYAAVRGMGMVQASVNLGRRAAYAEMKRRSYRTQVSGVAMLRPDGAGYDDAGVPVLEEWR